MERLEAKETRNSALTRLLWVLVPQLDFLVTTASKHLTKMEYKKHRMKHGINWINAKRCDSQKPLCAVCCFGLTSHPQDKAASNRKWRVTPKRHLLSDVEMAAGLIDSTTNAKGFSELRKQAAQAVLLFTKKSAARGMFDEWMKPRGRHPRFRCRGRHRFNCSGKAI